MWNALLSRVLRRLIREGQLVLHIANGAEQRFGDGTEPTVRIHIKDAATVRRLLLDPELVLGETYMEGALSIAGDDVQGLMDLVTRNTVHRTPLSFPAHVLGGLRHLRRRLDQANPEAASRRNVAHHYDLTPEIYDLFLDADRQYSCAYFTNPTLSLDAAQ